MLKGILKNGFEWEIDEAELDDYELIEQFSDLTENPMIFPKIIKKVLGEKQLNDLKNHIRETSGSKRISIKVMEESFMEILTSNKETKN